MKRKNSLSRNRWKILLFVLLSLGFFHLLFALLSGKQLWSDNPYCSYRLQAEAWAGGRLDLGQDYSWLELAIYDGRYYVSFPPFPSYLLFPFALLFPGVSVDGFLAFASVLLGGACACRLGERLGLSERAQIFLPIFLYCGTNLWQITVDGWVWFLAQNLAISLTLLSFLAALSGRRGLSLLALCAAVGCRPFQLVYLPVCLYLLYRKTPGETCLKRWKRVLFHRWPVYLPALALALSFLALNAARFGSPLEFGHNYLPEFTEAPEGQFSLSYLGENVWNSLRVVVQGDNGRPELPTANGMNLFLVFPLLLSGMVAFFRALRRSRKEDRSVLLTENLGMAVLCLCHLLFLLSHKTMGGSHFGNRYVADLMPAVYLILLRNLSRHGGGEPSSLAGIPAFALPALWGFLFNFYGVLQYYSSMA